MAPKSKQTPASAPAQQMASPEASGTATPTSTADKKDGPDAPAGAVIRPDKKAYDQEQERIKREIDVLQAKLSAVKDKIALASKSGSGNDRRNALRAELDSLRERQSSSKQSRTSIQEQIKKHNDNIQKKLKDLQAAKSKMPYKSVIEVDAHIKNLEKQVESGSMKLADEKRALQEISTCKRNRRLVESFQTDQDAMDSERQVVDELKKQLDDPEAKATSERYDAIKKELDQLREEGNEAYAGRTKLYEERDGLQTELNALYNQRRENSQQYKDANDRYWNKVNEDRARRAERLRAQRAADEAQKKREVAERLREEAEIPAFQAQIEDCQTLIDVLSGKTTGAVEFKSNGTVSADATVAGVPKLELRTVESEAPEGLVARKKKGEDEESYFVGGKTKSKGKKNSAKAANGTADAASGNLNLPFSTLSALLTLSIPPPSSSADVPRVIEDLKTKKAWYEANQSRVTAENIAKAEAEIKRLTIEESKSTETPSAVAESSEATETTATPAES